MAKAPEKIKENININLIANQGLETKSDKHSQIKQVIAELKQELESLKQKAEKEILYYVRKIHEEQDYLAKISTQLEVAPEVDSQCEHAILVGKNNLRIVDDILKKIELSFDALANALHELDNPAKNASIHFLSDREIRGLNALGSFVLDCEDRHLDKDAVHPKKKVSPYEHYEHSKIYTLTLNFMEMMGYEDHVRYMRSNFAKLNSIVRMHVDMFKLPKVVASFDKVTQGIADNPSFNIKLVGYVEKRRDIPLKPKSTLEQFQGEPLTMGYMPEENPLTRGYMPNQKIQSSATSVQRPAKPNYIFSIEPQVKHNRPAVTPLRAAQEASSQQRSAFKPIAKPQDFNNRKNV